jgi:hypothetical protein
VQHACDGLAVGLPAGSHPILRSSRDGCRHAALSGIDWKERRHIRRALLCVRERDRLVLCVQSLRHLIASGPR